ncbi:hypothetical protein ABT392_16670 [Paucibacter sp. JuS9]|uniref:hypothetical protein n=1 Tax=Paucibacter sp. JuS9 TaxID=3228748 RepID=UPI00375739A6
MATNFSTDPDQMVGGPADAPAALAAVAKSIGDLDELVTLIGRGLSRAKPWQRQLGNQLAEIDRLLQILRMTVAMERADAEILGAADVLCAQCRKAGTLIVGSRSDLTTKAAVRLIADLANKVRHELKLAQGHGPMF